MGTGDLHARGGVIVEVGARRFCCRGRRIQSHEDRSEMQKQQGERGEGERERGREEGRERVSNGQKSTTESEGVKKAASWVPDQGT